MTSHSGSFVAAHPLEGVSAERWALMTRSRELLISWGSTLATELPAHDAEWEQHFIEADELLRKLAADADIELQEGSLADQPPTQDEVGFAWQSVGEVMADRLLSAAVSMGDGDHSGEDWYRQAMRIDEQRRRPLPRATGLEAPRAEALLRHAVYVSIRQVFVDKTTFYGPTRNVSLLGVDGDRIRVANEDC